MKKSILWLGLGLGLLVPKEGHTAEPICADNGYCYLRSYIPTKPGESVYFFSGNHNLIARRGSVDWSKPIIVRPEAFPIHISYSPTYKEEEIVYTITDPHCYTVNFFIKYYTTRLVCNAEAGLLYGSKESQSPK